MTTNSMTERAKGTMEVVKGTVQKAVGKATDDDEMEAKGLAQQVVGGARVEAAKAAERTKGAVEQAVGAVKKTAGKIIDDKSMEVEGKVEELKGKARRSLNK